LEWLALGPQALVVRTQPLTFGLRPLLLCSQRDVLTLKPGEAPTNRPGASIGLGWRLGCSDGCMARRHAH
jgi:hypothetical protein